MLKYQQMETLCQKEKILFILDQIYILVFQHQCKKYRAVIYRPFLYSLIRVRIGEAGVA